MMSGLAYPICRRIARAGRSLWVRRRQQRMFAVWFRKRDAVLLSLLLGSGCHFFREVGQPLPVEHDYYVQRVLNEVSYLTPESTVRTDEIPTGPKGLAGRETDRAWALPLSEAVHIALQNSLIIKQDAQFLSLSNPLHRHLEASTSSLDPDIQAASINFGDRGVTAALSDFSPRLSGNLLFGRDERIQNNLFMEGLPPGSVLNDDSTNFLLRVDKQVAWGGQFAIDHTIDYSDNNSPARQYPSQYTGGMNFSYSQPLWAGAGTEFTQIAGPAAFLDTRIMSVNQGILIAKIDGELSRLDFEESLNGLVKDVTDVYWDLAQARSELHMEEDSLKRLRELWERQQTELQAGRTSQADEASAAEAVFAAEARVEQAWAQVNSAELRLRRLLSLPAHDGQTILPIEVPMVVNPGTEYVHSLATALGRRPELKRTKWQLRSLQLQLRAANSLVNPNVNLRMGYRFNGFGDDLFGPSHQQGFYGNMFRGQQTGWNAGVVFSMPLGFLQERAQVRNMELRVVKAQAAVAAQEEEISYELTNAHNAVQLWERTSSLFQQRLEAAERKLNSVEAEYEADRTSLSALVDARQSYVRAKIEFHRSLVELSKAVFEIYFREGALLDQQQVHLEFQAPVITPVPAVPPADGPDEDEIDPPVNGELTVSGEG